MSTIDSSSETSIQSPDTGSVDFKLEVVVMPVSDADRTKQFYVSLGWREDADFVIGEDYRVLQFTPPGSQAWIIFGTGVTDAERTRWDWYVPYLSAREHGSTSEQADAAADRYMAEVRGVVKRG